MRSRSPDGLDEAGTVTAEFAVALPAIVLVLACALGGIDLGGEQLRLQAGTFDAARLLGRGDAGALGRLRTVAPNATMSTSSSGDAVCVQAAATVSLGVLSGIALHASACALSDAQP